MEAVKSDQNKFKNSNYTDEFEKDKGMKKICEKWSHGGRKLRLPLRIIGVTKEEAGGEEISWG